MFCSKMRFGFRFHEYRSILEGFPILPKVSQVCFLPTVLTCLDQIWAKEILSFSLDLSILVFLNLKFKATEISGASNLPLSLPTAGVFTVHQLVKYFHCPSSGQVFSSILTVHHLVKLLLGWTLVGERMVPGIYRSNSNIHCAENLAKF